jgi:hypothetical protein
MTKPRAAFVVNISAHLFSKEVVKTTKQKRENNPNLRAGHFVVSNET